MRNKLNRINKKRLFLLALICCVSLGAYLAMGVFGKPPKVAKLKIGETYVEYDQDKTRLYVKLIDKKNLIYVEDYAHLSKRYYEIDGDSKGIHIITGTYRREKDDFVQGTYTVNHMLSFSPDIKVKPGVSGEFYNIKLENNGRIGKFQSGTSLDKDHGYYHFGSAYDRRIKQNTPKSVWDNSVGWLQVSKAKLPDTVEEYEAQYKLRPWKATT